METFLCFQYNMFWWSLFCICCFALFGNDDVGKGLTLAMKGRPYYKEDAIIKTFELNGDIIDCIDIYKQPAFDHPLLKNHTIQMKPTFIPQRPTRYSQATISNDSAVEDTHPWLFTKGSCPEGSIPITRMPYMDGHVGNNVTASDMRMYHPRYPRERGGTKGKKYDDPTWHELAMVEFTANNKFYGASAKFNVQRPLLEVPQEFSTAQMWIVSDDETTTLEAGWAVIPRLYHDSKTRLFTFWSKNNGETQCFNLLCPGFVWTNPNISLYTPLEPLSVYGGLQHEIEIEIFQDINRMNWWLSLQGHLLGYWPKSIVPKLGNGAHILTIGGEILNKRLSGHHTLTQMGSGHFAEEGFRKAAFITNVMILEDLRSPYTSPVNRGTPVVTHPNCYNLKFGEHMDWRWGYHFFYGGPGRSSTCT